MIRIIDSGEIEQGSEEWLDLRSNYVTGTDAAMLLKGYSVESLLERKQEAKNFSNYWTTRGHILEEDAKELYSEIYGTEIREVGFVINDKYEHCGVSPDGLIGDDGVVEVKCFKAERHVKVFENLTPAIIAQTQYEMFVTERDYCQFIMYCPDIKDNGKAFLTKRLEKNEAIWREFAKKLGGAKNDTGERFDK